MVLSLYISAIRDLEIRNLSLISRFPCPSHERRFSNFKITNCVTSEVGHAVDYGYANGDLGRLRGDVTRQEAVSGEYLESIHCILGKRWPVVATTCLPFSTPVTDNCINRAVTPRPAAPGGHILLFNEGYLRGTDRRNALRAAMAAWHGLVL
ncbi:MAG: hypothetical protein E5299_00306 [Burkholderia gladioli]|nr:MAG: hypothetical protein E5299_00306 [Burkholderia gladioli]